MELLQQHRVHPPWNAIPRKSAKTRDKTLNRTPACQLERATPADCSADAATLIGVQGEFPERCSLTRIAVPWSCDPFRDTGRDAPGGYWRSLSVFEAVQTCAGGAELAVV